MIVWTYAVLVVFCPCVLYFVHVKLSMFDMENCSRNTFIIIIIINMCKPFFSV